MMSDCYKEIIRDLCDFSATWTGYEAKILDECNLGRETVVDINSWDLQDEITDEMYAGTTNPISVTHCLPLPFTPEFAELITEVSDTDASGVPPLVQGLAMNFYNAFGNYVWNTYSDNNAIEWFE